MSTGSNSHTISNLHSPMMSLVKGDNSELNSIVFGFLGHSKHGNSHSPTVILQKRNGLYRYTLSLHIPASTWSVEADPHQHLIEPVFQPRDLSYPHTLAVSCSQPIHSSPPRLELSLDSWQCGMTKVRIEPQNLQVIPSNRNSHGYIFLSAIRYSMQFL